MLRNKFLSAFLALVLTAGSAYAISPVISWMMDMANQQSVKPQGEGSMSEFPLGSVTTDGIVVSSDGYHNPEAESGLWLSYRNDQSQAPRNPVSATPESIENGKYLYTVYCSACHGDDGMAQTSVGTLRGAIPIAVVLGADPTLAPGYLYSKIKFGSLAPEGMPPFGYATTAKERWDIVNYIRSKWPAASN